MAEKRLRTIEFRGLGTTYTIPEVDPTSSVTGNAADAKVVGDHIKDKENPHGVTAEQIGATPASHATDKNNPHNVTADQIGAAPAGYGLGTNSKNLTSADDLFTQPNGNYGWYGSPPANAPSFANAGNGYCYARVDCANDSSSKRVTVWTYMSGYESSVLVAIKKEGTWQPWEWENPPMSLDVEYRTTERIDSKAVYKKKNSSGQILYRLDGETEWKAQAPLMGAAPAGIVSKYTIVADESALNNALTETINAMANDTAKFLAFYPTSSALFGGKGMFCELYRRNASYAVARFTSYGITSPDILYKTLWNGTWTSFTDGSPSAFAPSGYGNYGKPLEGLSTVTGTGAPTTEAELENALSVLLEQMNINEIRRYSVVVPGMLGGIVVGDWAWATTVYKTSTAYAIVTMESGYGNRVCRLTKAYSNGVWQPAEWVDPPLQVGVQYRTTMRDNGKALYLERGGNGSIFYRRDGEDQWYCMASRIDGTFANVVAANPTAQDPATRQLRNSTIVSTETNPSYNGEICWVYE